MATYPEIGDVLEAVRLYAATHFPALTVTAHNYYRLEHDKATDKAAMASGIVRVTPMKPDISKDLRSPRTTVFPVAVNFHQIVADDNDPKIQAAQNALILMGEEAFKHDFLAAAFKASPSIRTLRCISVTVSDHLTVSHLEQFGLLSAGLVLDIQRIRP